MRDKNNDETTVDVIDTSHYIRVLAHDGQDFFTLWLDQTSIASKQYLGNGRYDESQPPVSVYRVQYKNGMVEDLLDKWEVLR